MMEPTQQRANESTVPDALLAWISTEADSPNI